MPAKRKDSKRAVLRKGETQRKNGTYTFRYQLNGERKAVYAKTLEDLRLREEEIAKDIADGIRMQASSVTLNQMFELWKEVKRGIRDTTYEGYVYSYERFVKPQLGDRKVKEIRKSDIRKLYIYLAENKGLKASTIEGVQNILHQLFDLAVDDSYIRSNPANNALKELKRSKLYDGEKKRGLTIAEQQLFTDYMRRTPTYMHWYPIFTTMLYTGMRVGEITGLTWKNIDTEEKMITVDHNLVYFNHRSTNTGCYFEVHDTKTEAGTRQIPMLDEVTEALEMEKYFQESQDMKSSVKIDGYSDFVFINKLGRPFNQHLLNCALKRIIRDCNTEQFEKSDNPKVLLPDFSCHNLRHTFTTRLVEAGMNPKVVQSVLGHTDIRTTLNIYADVTKDFKKDEFKNLNIQLKLNFGSAERKENTEQYADLAK